MVIKRLSNIKLQITCPTFYQPSAPTTRWCNMLYLRPEFMEQCPWVSKISRVDLKRGRRLTRPNLMLGPPEPNSSLAGSPRELGFFFFSFFFLGRFYRKNKTIQTNRKQMKYKSFRIWRWYRKSLSKIKTKLEGKIKEISKKQKWTLEAGQFAPSFFFSEHMLGYQMISYA